MKTVTAGSLTILSATIIILAAGVVSILVFVHHMEEAYSGQFQSRPACRSEVASLLRADIHGDEIGTFVFVNDVQLEPGPAPSLFFATGSMGKKILVEYNRKTFRLAGTSRRVSVVGIIRNLPAWHIRRPKWAIQRSTWRGLTPVYIEAGRITNVERTPAS